MITRTDLEAACGSTRWVEAMATRLPFHDDQELHRAADECFDVLEEDDWLEAFAEHPRIGDVDALRERFVASGALSELEQAGLAGTADDVLTELATGNDTYEQRFGFVFLVRAAGRTALEMLELQRARLANDRATELHIAAQQQREISHLRLEAAVAASDPVRPDSEGH